MTGQDREDLTEFLESLRGDIPRSGAASTNETRFSCRPFCFWPHAAARNAAGPETTGPVYFKVDARHRRHGYRDHQIHRKKARAQACRYEQRSRLSVKAHQGSVYDESEVVNPNGALANVFIYVKTGLEGKTFEPPSMPVAIDQKGCLFHPRVMGIQVGQTLSVINSDPVTHNIHPMAEINREWNHSQGEGDAAAGAQIHQSRKF